jgi:hypothetical protein
VAGEHERQQLVAQLLVGQHLAVLGARKQQQRQDVAALVEVADGAPGLDQRVGRPIQRHERGLQQPDRLRAPDVAQLGELRQRPCRHRQQLDDLATQPVLARAALGRALDAEDPGHDHVQRDRLHAWRERQRLTDRPAVDLLGGRALDHRLVAGDRLAVERRQQQLALAQMARPDRGQHRVGPDDRPQRRLAGQRRRQVRLGGEERLDVIGVAGDRRAAGHHAVHAEDVAVQAARAEHELDLALAEAQHLQRARQLDVRRRGELRRILGRQRPGRRGRGLPDEAGARGGSLGVDRLSQSHDSMLHRLM